MQQITKLLFTWFLCLFNVVLYSQSDKMDSLVLDLSFVGLEHQANQLLHLHQVIEQQQAAMMLLDGFMCLFMLVSVLFLYIINQDKINLFSSRLYRKLQYYYSFIKNSLKLKNKKTWQSI